METKNAEMSLKNIEALLMMLIQSVNDLQVPAQEEKPEQPEYGLVLNIDEAVKFTGLTKGKLYQYAREEKDFPVIRDGEDGKRGRVFFSRDGLVRWVREHEGKTI